MRQRVLFPLLLVMVALLAPPVTSADTSASRPIWPSIAIDASNHVHVAYDNADGPGIIYATNRSGSWTRKRITSGDDRLPRIAVDANGIVRVVFVRTFTDSPRRNYYVTNTSGSWVTKQLPWTAPGSTVRMAIDITRKVHVVHATDTATYYTTNASGSWVRTRLDFDYGASPLVATDPNGAVHLVFSQCLNQAEDEGFCKDAGLYHRTNASGSWKTTRVTTVQLDRATGLVADADGNIHLVYTRANQPEGAPTLDGMYYVTGASGSYVEKRVAGSGREGRIAVDPRGSVHIVYNRDSDIHRGIYYVTNESGTWAWSTAVKEHSMYQELAVDTRGVVRMVFMRMAIDPGVYYSHDRWDTWRRLELMD